MTVLSSFVLDVLFSHVSSCPLMSAAVLVWLYVLARLVHMIRWWPTVPYKAASNTSMRSLPVSRSSINNGTLGSFSNRTPTRLLVLHTTYTCAFKPGCLISHN